MPLEWLCRVREPHKGDLWNVGTSEGFAQDAHKDERWEGGLIGAEQAKLALRYAKGKEARTGEARACTIH